MLASLEFAVSDELLFETGMMTGLAFGFNLHVKKWFVDCGTILY